MSVKIKEYSGMCALDMLNEDLKEMVYQDFKIVGYATCEDTARILVQYTMVDEWKLILSEAIENEREEQSMKYFQNELEGLENYKIIKEELRKHEIIK